MYKVIDFFLKEILSRLIFLFLFSSSAELVEGVQLGTVPFCVNVVITKNDGLEFRVLNVFKEFLVLFFVNFVKFGLIFRNLACQCRIINIVYSFLRKKCLALLLSFYLYQTWV